jgi:hypothetical protein
VSFNERHTEKAKSLVVVTQFHKLRREYEKREKRLFLRLCFSYGNKNMKLCDMEILAYLIKFVNKKIRLANAGLIFID